MNKEDIIRMAQQAGIDGVIQTTSGRSVALDMHKIERLVQAAYAAGAAAEREACAKVCEELRITGLMLDAYSCNEATYKCADAIRARVETTSKGNT